MKNHSFVHAIYDLTDGWIVLIQSEILVAKGMVAISMW